MKSWYAGGGHREVGIRPSAKARVSGAVTTEPLTEPVTDKKKKEKEKKALLLGSSSYGWSL